MGRAAICAAVLVVPLLYVPGLESPFSEPKLALLLVAGALGDRRRLLGLARLARRARAGTRTMRNALLARCSRRAPCRRRSRPARGPPGAPYARVELARLLAMVGVAVAAAQRGR